VAFLRAAGLALLLVLSQASVESTASAERGPATGRYQPAIELGDLEALEKARLEIQRTIAIGGVESGTVSSWRYDWAYLNWRISQLLRYVDNKHRKKLLKEAQQQLDLVLESDAEDPEAHALRGSVIGDRIEGGLSGALLGPRAGSSLERALELAPDNPRVVLQQGISSYFTPRTFGGGEEAALEELRRAVELFEAQPSDQGWPNWGEVDALAWLGIVLSESGEIDEARALFERALSIQPRNAWVRALLIDASER
jgi:tetratricopeptide (TPR) repeat protein